MAAMWIWEDRYRRTEHVCFWTCGLLLQIAFLVACSTSKASPMKKNKGSKGWTQDFLAELIGPMGTLV